MHEIGAAAIIPVAPSRRGSLEHDSVIDFATLRTRGARRKVDEVELEVARLGARGRQL